MPTTKTNHYNYIKFLATILVVIGHSSRMYTGKGIISPLNGSQLICYLCEFIYSFHMALFIAVSGMVYGVCIVDLKKYRDQKQFIQNKLKRLIIPYFVWGALLIAPVMCLWNFTEKTYIRYLIDNIFLLGDSRHLWFLVVLFEIFILCSMLIPKGWYHSVLLIGMFCLSCISGKVPDIFQLSNVCYYLLFFFVGYEINNRYKTVVKILMNPIVIVLLFSLLLVLFNINIRPIKVIKALLGIGVFVGITGFCKPQISCNSKIYKLNKNGFGIYIFHPIIIYLLYYYFGRYDISSVLLFVLISILSYGISYLITSFIRNLRLGFMIGEWPNKKSVITPM